MQFFVLFSWENMTNTVAKITEFANLFGIFGSLEKNLTNELIIGLTSKSIKEVYLCGNGIETKIAFIYTEPGITDIEESLKEIDWDEIRIDMENSRRELDSLFIEKDI